MLVIKEVDFGYPSSELLLKNISLTVEKGSVLGLMGESGSGKSTLLKLIYGLLDADSGMLSWDDNSITGPKFNLIPGMPYMKYLAQDFDLMPYTSVEENIGQFLSNRQPVYKQQRVQELLELVDMTAFAKKHVKLLSGGQMQRVALAKALALEPEVLLLDEPFSHIDHFRKNELRRNLFHYVKQKKMTVVVATHHIDDVLGYADIIAVVREGALLAVDTPQKLYNTQDSLYVARLMGEVNVIPGNWFGAAVTSLFLRPHQLKIAASGVDGTVQQSYYLGTHYLIAVQIQQQIVFVAHEHHLSNNETVFLELQ